MPKDSPAQSFADLKGKKIAFLKSTNSYISFLHQLKEAGLQESDFQIVEITGPPANKAFETGQLDALLLDRPEHGRPRRADRRADHLDVRGLRRREPLPVRRDDRRDRAEGRGDRQGHPGRRRQHRLDPRANPDEQAALLAPKLGFSETAIKTTYARGAQRLQEIDDTFYAGEQAVIDELVDAGIVTKPIDVKDVYLPDFNDSVDAAGRRVSAVAEPALDLTVPADVG